MNEPKFTPGPWKVERSDAIGKERDLSLVLHMLLPDRAGDDALMSVVTYDRHMPNVTLVASAPSLYSALERLAGCVAGLGKHPVRDLDEAMEEARFALACARGEQP